MQQLFTTVNIILLIDVLKAKLHTLEKEKDSLGRH